MRSKLRHPIRAIREPFGTAGLIVACIALIAALGGSAVAAGKLTSKQKKEVEKIAKKYAGKPGAVGPAGPAGAPGSKGDAGAAGANGTAGTNGTNGTNGVSPVGTSFSGAKGSCTEGGVEFKGANTTFACNGAKGQTGFTETLPSGKTETGAWGDFNFIIGAEEKPVEILSEWQPLSFNIPLSAPPVANIIEGGEAVKGSLSNCDGSVEAPEADPGNFCLYVQPGSTPPPDAQVNVSGVYATGAILSMTLKFAAFTRGTWAVTAP